MQGVALKFSDEEVIALSLTEECLGIDSSILFSKRVAEYRGRLDLYGERFFVLQLQR